jgi:hypothetical protein
MRAPDQIAAPGAERAEAAPPPADAPAVAQRRWRLPALPAPVVAFVLVYVGTCLLGAILFLANERTFIALYEYFSGTEAPDLTAGQLRIDLALLVAAPVLMVAGYLLGDRVAGRLGPRVAARTRGVVLHDAPGWLPYAAFAVCAAWGVWSLAGAGVASDIGTWLDYASWIEARQRAFGNIGFFGFANLYLLVPVTAAWCVVRGACRPAGWRRVGGVLATWAPAAVAVGFCLLLFQKKAAVVALIIIGAARFAFAPPRGLGRQRLIVAGTAGVVIALYFATVVVPVIVNAPTDAELRRDPNRPAVLGPGTDRTRGLVLYALLAPVTRTSAPALYYPVVYPDQHPYYGLDVGQDVLGIGAMPDDNIVVWRQLNPDLDGTITVPFQFSLYSQVGLLGALVSSFVVGVLLALAWRCARSGFWPREWRSLLTALMLLLAIYLAIDSARNSTLVSYGVVWPVLFVLGTIGVSQLVATRTRSRRARAGIGDPRAAGR